VSQYPVDRAGAGGAPEACRTATDCCPICGGEVTHQKCKVVCKRCHSLISNCNGD